MLRKLALVAMCSATAMAAGCRSDNNFQAVDLAMGGDDGGGGGGDGGGGGGDGGMGAVKCAAGYTDSTIAAMRAAAKSGCFKITNAVALAVQSTSTHSTLVMQDTAGGDNSALGADCDTRSKAVTAGYACTVLSTFKNTPKNESVTLGGFYVHTMAGLEFFNVIDTFTDTGSVSTTIPAPLVLALSDIKHSGGTVTATKAWQFATVTVGTTLSTYEFAPAEFKPTTAPTSCTQYPYTFGFGLIPTGTGTAGPSCTMGGMAAPVSGTPDPAEILVDTSFYSGFKLSSDCACSMTANLITAGETFNKLQGIVKMQGAAPSIAPLVNGDVGK